MPRVIGYGRTVLLRGDDFDRLERFGLVRRSNATERVGFPTSAKAAAFIADQYPFLDTVEIVDDDEPATVDVQAGRPVIDSGGPPSPAT